MKERIILHSDMNCFYASVEMLHHPEFRGKPLAVGGDPEARHGIVLTANYIAKRRGVKTGMVLWQARQLCPDLIVVPARMDLYMRFSEMAREIYLEYTDRVEPYGIDEAWLDVTSCCQMKAMDGKAIAEEISHRIKYELGVTVSIGVSWNKIFAKLGSDYKKPDGITVFDRKNYQSTLWKLPVSDLLYVGRHTAPKLRRLGIQTIGELAGTNPEVLTYDLGKMGRILWSFANGYDEDPVSTYDHTPPVKSIGNSTTTPRDLMTDQDVWIILMALSESVSARLRSHSMKCKTIGISIRSSDLMHFSKQIHVDLPTSITDEIAHTAFVLYKNSYDWKNTIRSLSVRASELVMDDQPIQLCLFDDQMKREKLEKADRAVDRIRSRYGYFSIQRAVMYQDKLLSHLDARSHVIHPHSYFHG